MSSFILTGLFLPRLLDWSGGFGMSSFVLAYALSNVRKRFLHVVTLKSTGQP